MSCPAGYCLPPEKVCGKEMGGTDLPVWVAAGMEQVRLVTRKHLEKMS